MLFGVGKIPNTDSACLEANSRPCSEEPACHSTGRFCGDGATKLSGAETDSRCATLALSMSRTCSVAGPYRNKDLQRWAQRQSPRTCRGLSVSLEASSYLAFSRMSTSRQRLVADS